MSVQLYKVRVGSATLRQCGGSQTVNSGLDFKSSSESNLIVIYFFYDKNLKYRGKKSVENKCNKRNLKGLSHKN